MQNGKGDKQRVRWSKNFEKNFNKIFNKPKVKKEN
tara:strand:- start:3380 stop:3484 length:105 start_codon:yes stop_codon:yes gene_type:complete